MSLAYFQACDRTKNAPLPPTTRPQKENTLFGNVCTMSFIQLVDLYNICTSISLGQTKGLIRFVTFTSNHRRTVNITFHKNKISPTFTYIRQALSSYKKLLSCIPDKDIRVFYLDRQFLSHPCYLTQGRIKITFFKALVV